MQISHFKEIVSYSKSHSRGMESKIRAFYNEIEMDDTKDLLNLMQVVRPVFKKKHYFLFELPFRDKEIGAFCYNGDAIGYTFLNSALPKVNVNFALCHELYHILFENDAFKRKVELYLSDYYSYEEERAANLFAGMLLMPKQSFSLMFSKFKRESQEETKEVIAKLMSYFETPYMATLLRCYELDLLESGIVLEELLKVDSVEIKALFENLWLDESILYASKKDDYSKLEKTIEVIGKKYIEDGYVSEREVRIVQKNMREIYQEIRGGV